MPSVKVLDSIKSSTPELVADGGAVVSEAAINDGEPTKDSFQVPGGNQPPTNNSNNPKDCPNPLQQMILIIEHKIRNLEKRKNKLDSYKTIEKSGKKLTGDQKVAVSKYDECIASLELARELSKQFQAIAVVANKEAKKEAKRSAFVRAQQENAKVRECLIIQDVLRRLSETEIRNDFQNGSNGACKLSEQDFELLFKLHEEIKPKRPSCSTDAPFTTTVKAAADHLSGIVDGRNKAFGDTNYVQLKLLLTDIHSCGYFDSKLVTEKEGETAADATGATVELDATKTHGSMDTVTYLEQKVVNEEQAMVDKATDSTQTINSINDPSSRVFGEAPAATAVPTPSFPLQNNAIRAAGVMNSAQIIAPTVPMNITAALIDPTGNAYIVPRVPVPVVQPATASLQPIAGGQQVAATTVQAVENTYFKQHYMQQLRPLHEVLGSGNFFFLQESEIDKPDSPGTNSFSSAVAPNTLSAGKSLVADNQDLTQGVSASIGNQLSPGSAMGQNNVVANAQHTQQMAQIRAQPNAPMLNTPVTNQPNTANESQNFNPQAFQNMVPNHNNYNRIHPAAPEARQQNNQQVAQITHQPIQAVKSSGNALKPNELSHIPGFVSSNTTIVSSTMPVPNNHQQQAAINLQQTLQQQPASGNVPAGNQLTSISPVQQSSQLQNDVAGTNPIAVSGAYGVSNVQQQFPTLLQNATLGINTNQMTATNATAPAASIAANMSTIITDTATIEKRAAPYSIAEKFTEKSLNQGQQLAHTHPSKNPCPKTQDELKEWNNEFGNNTNKNDDQWPSPASSVAQSQSKIDENFNRNQYNRARQLSGSNANAGAGTAGSLGTTNRAQQNGNVSSKYGNQSGATVPNNMSSSQHQAPNSQAGFRNNRTANAQFQQNGTNNARYGSENNGMNNTPTFFKNNERYYQNNNYNQNNHQRGNVYKSRTEGNSGNISSRGASAGNNGYNGVNVSGSAGVNNIGGLDYRSNQNARPGNSTRNTGPPSSRPHQRNNSGGAVYGVHPRGGSNSRSQSGVNA